MARDTSNRRAAFVFRKTFKAFGFFSPETSSMRSFASDHRLNDAEAITQRAVVVNEQHLLLRKETECSNSKTQ